MQLPRRTKHGNSDARHKKWIGCVTAKARTFLLAYSFASNSWRRDYRWQSRPHQASKPRVANATTRAHCSGRAPPRLIDTLRISGVIRSAGKTIESF
jgi:hypothetical protein